MSADSSTGPDQRSSVDADVNRDDDDFLILALNHSCSWYDIRIGRGLQVVNYLLLSMAILSTAYVGALNAKIYGVAAVVSILACVFTAIAYTIGLRQFRSASLARPAIAEAQKRIAARLGIDSLRLVKEARSMQYGPSVIVFAIVFISCVVSFVYALTR